MRTAFAIARKELGIYFTTPWAYVVFTLMLFMSAIFFVHFLDTFRAVNEVARERGWGQIPGDMQVMRNLTDGVAVPMWSLMLIVTLFAAPFLSMRLFAEEKRQKTFELLMTTPIRPAEIVAGKYLAAMVMVGVTLGLTLVFPLILAIYGRSESGSALEWSTVMLGYLAMLMWGFTCMAIGMFISALTESQMVAALVTFVIGLLWIIAIKGVAPQVDEPLRSFINYIAFDSQLSAMLRGVLEVKALVFCASAILFFNFLTHRAIEAQRWR